MNSFSLYLTFFIFFNTVHVYYVVIIVVEEEEVSTNYSFGLAFFIIIISIIPCYYFNYCGNNLPLFSVTAVSSCKIINNK